MAINDKYQERLSVKPFPLDMGIEKVIRMERGVPYIVIHKFIHSIQF